MSTQDAGTLVAASGLVTVSDSFSFVGADSQGHVAFAIDNIRVLADDETIFALGSAAAQLTWKERVISGRVIYEYLVKKHFNLMTRRSLKGLVTFQGLYLLAGMASDLYIQHSLMKLTVAGMPPLLSFWVPGSQTEQLDQPRFEVLKHALAFGPYRWPAMWHIHWRGSKGLVEALVTLSPRKPLGNWVLAGFSME